MIEKVLGKISNAEFGTYPDRPFLYGLQLDFKMSYGGIGSGAYYTVNISDECKWEDDFEKYDAYEEYLVENVAKILKDAKVNYISELVDKPVEITIEDRMFKDFRILTEVI